MKFTQRSAALGEMGLALVLLIVALWQWLSGVNQSRTPVVLPNGVEQWLTVYDGPRLITAFVLAAAAVLLAGDGALRLRR